MYYYQMNKEQLENYFSNPLEPKNVNDPVEKSSALLYHITNVFDLCRVRFSFVFIPLMICHALNLIFSILNKDWRLLIIGLILFLGSFLFSIAECVVLFFERKRYNDRILSDENKVKVIKNGNVIEINADQLICGDHIIFEKGDMVPADSRVILAQNLYANEDRLFGKTIPSIKSANIIDGDKLYPEEQSNMIWKGSYISDGSGEAIVVAINDDCFISKTGNRKESSQKSALYNQKNNIGKITEIIYFMVSALLLIIAGALTGKWLEALLVFSSFISLFVIEPTAFITEWTYYNTAAKLYKKGILVRNIQAFDGINKEKELYVLPVDLLDDSMEYDEIINISGSETLNRIFVDEHKNCFGNVEISFVQNEGEEFAVAAGYWKDILPFIKEMDDSLSEYIGEFEAHGFLVGAICAKEKHFTRITLKNSDYYGELSLRCLILKRIQLDKTLCDQLNRLRKSKINIFLVREYSDDVSNFISSTCDIKVIDEKNLKNNTYSLPLKSDIAVFNNASQIQKKNAHVVFDENCSPIQTIYGIKCMICGIERSLNFLYILLLGLIAGSFVCFLKNLDVVLAFPILLLHPILLLLCHHIVNSAKNCNQSKLSLAIGGLFLFMILASAFILGSGAVAAWAFSFVFYATVLYLRRFINSRWSTNELFGIIAALFLAILICLFAEFNVIVALLFAIFPALATIIVDIIY